MGFADAVAKAGYENAEKQEVTQFLTTGYPVLDQRLTGKYKGGGLPAGRIVEIMGPSSSGKTAIATNAMVCVQQAGGLAGFDDHERSFDLGLAKAFGLNDDPNFFCYGTPTTFEQSLEQMKRKVLIARGMVFDGDEFVRDPKLEAYFPAEVPFVWVFDSLASMVPQSVLVDSKGEEKAAGDRNMNDNTALARATSAHFPWLAKFAEATNTTVIFLNQVRTKIGTTGKTPQYTAPGGNAPEFYATVRIRLGRTMKYDEKLKAYTGQTINAEVIKNKVYRPFTKCGWDFDFQVDGTGKFDVVGGVIDELVTLGRIEQSGAWITWDGKKWNSRKALHAHIEDNGQVPQLIGMLP